MKTLILITILLLNGCTTKERIIKVPTYREVKIPKSLLITYKAPKQPSSYTEEEVSKYTLELYKRFKKNNSKKKQIEKIISNYNSKI